MTAFVKVSSGVKVRTCEGMIDHSACFREQWNAVYNYVTYDQKILLLCTILIVDMLANSS